TGEIRCFDQSTGGLEVSVEGGKSPYQFNWNSGETAAALDSRRAGSYTVTVTDAAGNVQTATSTIVQPDAIQVTVTADAAASTNAADGKASAKASGGTGKHTFAWDNGEAGARASGLSAGTHAVTVTD